METLTTAGHCYIVGVMAHNEEHVIADTVKSVLRQNLEAGAILNLYVFANGCTDRTEQIVQELAARDERVRLVSLPRRGKVYALRQSIAYFIRLQERQQQIDRIFYVDADVTFGEPNTLMNLSRALDSSPDLYLVSSYPVFETTGPQTNWYLRLLSEIRRDVQSNLRVNLVRGACYVIRFSALRRVSYPKHLLSDDMYLELRLSGHFTMDYEHPAATKYKGSLKGAIQRELFTLIAREQVYAWYHQNKIDSLDPQSARDEWSLRFGSSAQFMWSLLRRGKLLSLAVMGTWLAIYKVNERRARLIFEESQKQQVDLLEYWSTER